MCQLSYVDLKDDYLNKLLFLIMSSIGSSVHKDGWGVANNDAESFKCSLPAGSTLNAGEILREFTPGNYSPNVKGYSPLMGHIRLASANIPVNDENAHPFTSENQKIIFFHNGTLKPKKEEDFILEFEEEVFDAKTKTKTKNKVKISDTVVFFSKFQEILSTEKDFIKALRDTMSLFYGKFAFIIYNYDESKCYIVRGKTADLYISYLKTSDRENAKSVGYVINTNKDILNMSTTLLSNIVQLNGKKELIFTSPKLLEKETIFEAREFDLNAVGIIKENDTPINQSSYPLARASYFWNDEDDSNKKVTKDTKESFYANEIYEFLKNFSLSAKDFQYIIFYLYGISILEIDETIAKHFVDKIIPKLSSLVGKETRRKVRNLCLGFPVSMHDYSLADIGLSYPWILSEKSSIEKYIKLLEKIHKESDKN